MAITPSRIPRWLGVSLVAAVVAMSVPNDWAKGLGAVLFFLVFLPGLLFAWGAERGQSRTRSTEVAHYAQTAQALHQRNLQLTEQLRSEEVRRLEAEKAALEAELLKAKNRPRRLRK